MRPLAVNRAYYRAHAEEFCRRSAALSMENSYEPFLEHIPSHGRILDAGCGSGRDSVEFMRRGYDVMAIDASPAMIQCARSQGVDARLLTFQRMRFTQEFDGIWACASLLHVPQAEIPAVLRRLAKALRRTGVLYASLKSGHGEKIAEDGRFFSYFSLAEFSNLLAAGNLFRVIRAWESNDTDSSGTVRTWLNFLARKTS